MARIVVPSLPEVVDNNIRRQSKHEGNLQPVAPPFFDSLHFVCFQLVLIRRMECKDRKVALGRPFQDLEVFRRFREKGSNDNSVC